MELFIEREQRKESLSFEGTVQQLLDMLSINAQTVLVIKNDALVTEDEELSDNDNVQVLTVVSGG